MKITIVGAAGGIGQALALLLKRHLPNNSELFLYDITEIMTGIAIDLSHIPTQVRIQGFSGKKYLCTAIKDANIILITAGIARKPGMDRSDLFNINSEIIFDLMNQIAYSAPEALIGIITNPINSTVVIASEVLKKHGVYDKKRLFGITTLDVIRAATFVSELKEVSPDTIDVNVIGGHSGATILPLLSQIKNITLNTKEIVYLTNRIQNAGTEIVEAKMGKGSATLSMAQAATRFVLSLVNAIQGKNNIVECAYVENSNAYSNFFAQPLLLGSKGIINYQPINNLSQFEEQILHNMLKFLEKDISQAIEFYEKHI